MSDRPFLDTNILVYAIGHDAKRTPRAEGLLAAGAIISVQVLNELAAVAHRKLKMSWSEVADALAALRSLCATPVPLTTQTHELGLRLASQYDFHIYDALIVGAALEAGCRLLYSEDMQAGQVVEGRLTIRNPFVD